MKLKCSLLIATLIIAGSAFSQNLLKLDNNPNAPTGTHVYADAATCIADAVDGDIIYVIPSADGYGDIVIDKELHFIGSGLVADTETGYNSKINSIVFRAAMANGSTLNGIELTAFNSYPITFGLEDEPADTLKNIEIFNCKYAGSVQLSNCHIEDLLIRNNLVYQLSIWGAGAALNFSTEPGYTSELIISNNVLIVNYGGGNVTSAINVANETVIANNHFNSYNGQPAFFRLYNCFVSNNIFNQSSPGHNVTYGGSYGNSYTNNLSFGPVAIPNFPPPASVLPNNTGSGNIDNTDPLFTSVIIGWSWSLSNDLSLSQFSPIIDAGSDGTDIGIMGGMYPFTNYQHLRSVPHIQTMEVPGMIMGNQNVQLVAVIKAN